MGNDLLVTSQSVIAGGWIEIGLCWWPIALLMRLQFGALLTMMLVYERWMARTRWNAVGEGGYERKGSRIEMVYVPCSWSGRPALPRIQHDSHHDTKVKPEAAPTVTELLMMGGKTSETYWAVNKRQDNKLKNCCIRLVIYLNCTMMHGLTNLKFCVWILAHSLCKMWIIH
jgi:hypothetical protein